MESNIKHFIPWFTTKKQGTSGKCLFKIRQMNTPVNEHVRICGEHFDPSSFLISYNGMKMLRKDAAIPAEEHAPPEQRLPLTEKTNTMLSCENIQSNEITSKETDKDEGKDTSLP